MFISKNVNNYIDIPAEDFIGKTHSELGYSKEMSAFWEEKIKRVFNTRKNYETEFAFDSKTEKKQFNATARDPRRRRSAS